MVERNGLFAHPENILIGMFGDSDKEIKSSTVRVFRLPMINQTAALFDQMATILGKSNL